MTFDLSTAMLEARKWKNNLNILRKITLSTSEYKIISCKNEDEINMYYNKEWLVEF